MRRIAVLDAPSNLGLRPPTATSVPGCAKAPGALRDHGLLSRLGARDAGCLTPPRYDPGDWRPGDGVAHAAQIAAYSRALADRIGAILDAGEFPVVLGGDCSILLGSGLAMHRLGEAVGGRIGLVFVDGHSDFRHPGNASYVGAAAGEDLALVTGRGQADLAAIEGRRPYFRDIDVVVLGIRAQDEYRLDLQAAGIVTRPVPALRAEGAARSAQWARDQLVDCAGYWLHVDVDVLDPAVLPAVDAPSPGGIAFPELELLLAGLVESPHCLGVEITVFDPDYDPDGSYAAEITSTVAAGLAAARTVVPRPDLAAARADLAKAPRRPDEAWPSAGETLARPVQAEESSSSPPARPASGESSASLVSVVPSPPSPESSDRPESPTSLSQAAPVSLPRAALSEESPDSEARSVSVARSVLADESWRSRVSLPRPSLSEESGPEDALARAVSADGSAVSVAQPASVEGSLGLSRRPLSAEESPGLLRRPVSAGESSGSLSAEGSPGLLRRSALSEDSSAVSEEPSLGLVGESQDESAVVEASLTPGPAEELSAESEEASGERLHRGADEPVRLASRPLGQAPLLDSEPLPATRPGMLRPRSDGDRAESFSLPVQRPAFDLGSGEPADIA